MRNRASREQAIAILEELSFNATYWDSENNGPDPKITDEIWNTALLIEQLYQRMESRTQFPYFMDSPEVVRSSMGETLEQIFREVSPPTSKQPIYQLHGFLKVFYETVSELRKTPMPQLALHPLQEKFKLRLPSKPMSLNYDFTLPTSGKLQHNRIFVSSLNALYLRLYNCTLLKNVHEDEKKDFEQALAIGQMYRKDQTQAISRTGRTCKSATAYFDQLLEQHERLIVVSLTLCRNSTVKDENMNYEWLIDEWKKFIQNGRSSRPMIWSLGFLAGIRATSAKGLYIHAYFFFDAEQADPKDLEHTVGQYWIQTTNGGYHATPITSVKKLKLKSVYETSVNDQKFIALMHNRIIPSLTQARLFVTPLAVLNKKHAPNAKPNQIKSETADVFLRGELPATRTKRKNDHTDMSDDPESLQDD